MRPHNQEIAFAMVATLLVIFGDFLQRQSSMAYLSAVFFGFLIIGVLAERFQKTK